MHTEVDLEHLSRNQLEHSVCPPSTRPSRKQASETTASQVKMGGSTASSTSLTHKWCRSRPGVRFAERHRPSNSPADSITSPGSTASPLRAAGATRIDSLPSARNARFSTRWIDEPHQQGAGRQPIADLRQHVSRPIGRRQRLDRQIGRELSESRWRHGRAAIVEHDQHSRCDVSVRPPGWLAHEYPPSHQLPAGVLNGIGEQLLRSHDNENGLITSRPQRSHRPSQPTAAVPRRAST